MQQGVIHRWFTRFVDEKYIDLLLLKHSTTQSPFALKMPGCPGATLIIVLHFLHSLSPMSGGCYNGNTTNALGLMLYLSGTKLHAAFGLKNINYYLISRYN